MNYDEDDSDQGFSSTDVCTYWKCNRAKLVLKKQFWCCPECHASYGTNPHPKCPPLKDSK